MTPSNLFADLLEEIIKDPLAVAAKLEKSAKEMLDLATKLRGAANDPAVARQGVCDRVKVAVYGPGNELKKYVEVA